MISGLARAHSPCALAFPSKFSSCWTISRNFHSHPEPAKEYHRYVKHLVRLAPHAWRRGWRNHRNYGDFLKPAKEYNEYLGRLLLLAPHARGNATWGRGIGADGSRKGVAENPVDSHVADAVKQSPIDAYNKTNRLHTVSIKRRIYSSIFLRDACTCQQCVDPSTKQKNFQTSDISPKIKAIKVHRKANGGVEINWENDLPGFGFSHTSIYPPEFFRTHSSYEEMVATHSPNELTRLWNSHIITGALQYVTYDDYINTEEGLFRALRMLSRYGLLLLRHVPESESSVVSIAERIGNLRDTFYGRTWDVRSVPQAKNVAYTAQYLGLHMDLLYMTNPPGFQFLHCLKNTCSGGSSIFSDAFHAVSKLDQRTFNLMTRKAINYHYRNAGEHYYYEHPLIERLNVGHVNYSPPFQAPFPEYGNMKECERTAALAAGLREFASIAEAPDSIYEYRLQEGECVIFNNRRVLHGRKEFDTTTGERWFKGAYVDTDAFMSRFRMLSERFKDQDVSFLENHARCIQWDIENPETGRRESDPLKVWPRSRSLPDAEEYAQMV
ncbi:gamma-butyrobetaine dioxygenase protein [Rutstroemia sp. NJR-2017a BBW]|nr:gamma-butyrobetaine dioxygenase protein [Rutstroemia sp. NJR-2017a BBW]